MPEYEPWKPDLELIKRLSSQGMSDKQICNRIGMHIDVFSEHRTNNKKLDEAVLLGLAESQDAISAKMLQKALSGNVIAMQFWLKAKGEWTEKKEDSQDGPTITNLPSSFTITSASPDKEE